MSDSLINVRIGIDPGEAIAPLELASHDRPFSIALLGDFSGRVSRGERRTDLSGLRPLRIDRDDFDQVLAAVGPRVRIRLDPGAAPLEIGFGELDDFHPDHLFQRLPLFQELRKLRKDAKEPGAFLRLTGPPPPRPEAAAPPPVSGSLLDQILEEVPEPANNSSSPSPSPDDVLDLQAYVRQIVAPHLVPDDDPRQRDVLERVDAAISEQMRALLHQPELQALESLWRAVFLLVRRIETDEHLRVFLIDVTRDELRADLAADRDLQGSALHRLLEAPAAGTPGGSPWSLLVGGYSFGPDAEDLALLRRMAELGRSLGAPWIAAAEPELVGCASFTGTPDPAEWSAPEAAWEELRREPAADHLGLAFPRFLLRLPYGEETDSCDWLSFEEMGGEPEHGDYLWGNPAFACALLLAQAFSAAGWKMRPGMVRDVERLPLHLVRREGEMTMQPCAEGWMTERAAQRILERGVMPLASMRDRDSVRLVRFQSVASPAAPLAGPWNAST